MRRYYYNSKDTASFMAQRYGLRLYCPYDDAVESEDGVCYFIHSFDVQKLLILPTLVKIMLAKICLWPHAEESIH